MIMTGTVSRNAGATASTPQHRDDTSESDFSAARCTGVKADAWPRVCKGIVCPRHDPAAYADSMARHATDSIR